MNSHAVADAMVCSKSLARRRFRLSQARVRSTTQRRGSTSKPFAASDRLIARPRGIAQCWGDRQPARENDGKRRPSWLCEGAQVLWPTWLAAHLKRSIPYAVGEKGSGGGGLAHLDYDPASGSLFVANFGSGVASGLPIDRSGRIGVGRGQDQGWGPNPAPIRTPCARGVARSKRPLSAKAGTGGRPDFSSTIYISRREAKAANVRPNISRTFWLRPRSFLRPSAHLQPASMSVL